MRYAYRIDMTPGGPPLILHVTQYDEELREYLFTPFDASGDVAKIAGCTVTLEATKPDGNALQHPCTYNADGTVLYVMGEQLAAAAGRVWSKLVWRSSGAVLGSAAILWMVDEAGIKDGAVISQSDIPTVEQIAELASAAASEADDSEAWAAGTRNGVPVGPTDPTYQNNAKYYAEQAGQSGDLTALTRRVATAEDDINALETAMTGKADTSAVNTALATKADASTVNAALEMKANTSTVNAALATKAGQTSLDATQGMITARETASTAAAAHAVGDLFVYNDVLYKATAAIAVGDTITPGTNCTATTLTASFQAGCDTIANAITAEGVTTPTDSSPAEIAAAIGTLSAQRYEEGETINYIFFTQWTHQDALVKESNITEPGTYIVFLAGGGTTGLTDPPAAPTLTLPAGTDATAELVRGVSNGVLRTMQTTALSAKDPSHKSYANTSVYRLIVPTASEEEPLVITQTFAATDQSGNAQRVVIRLGLPVVPWDLEEGE